LISRLLGNFLINTPIQGDTRTFGRLSLALSIAMVFRPNLGRVILMPTGYRNKATVRTNSVVASLLCPSGWLIVCLRFASLTKMPSLEPEYADDVTVARAIEGR